VSGIWAAPAGLVPSKINAIKYESVEKRRADVINASAIPEWVLPVDPWRWDTTDLWGAGRGHKGIDVAVRYGKPVYSVSKGVVVYAGWDWMYGNLVKIKYKGGYICWYAHLSKIKVKNGKKVSAADVIGYIGASGNAYGAHLHFGVEKNKQFIDPLPWLKKRISKYEWHRKHLW
jgi:murein DD-endopeptidase MepM/ murein hydrolase activator NlpD